MSVNIANAAIVFSGNTDPLQKSITNVVGALRGFERDLRQVGSIDPTKTMRDNIVKTNTDVVKLKTNFTGLAAGFAGGLAGGLASKLIEVANPLDALKGSIDLAGEAEANAMAFEVMTGSVEQAGKVLGDIRQYAKESPFGTKDITIATRSMIAMGISADQAVPSVKMLGEVASASGADAPEHLKRLTLAYGQVATAGRLMGTELKQFTEAGVPIIDALADVLQKPKEQIRGLVEDGKVAFPDLVRGFKSITEGAGKFAGMSERYSNTFVGKVEQFKDSLQSLGREFGTVIIEEVGLKQMAVDMASFTDRVRAGTGDLRPLVNLVGNVAKGTTQFAYEMGRAAVMIGQVRLEKLSASIPGLSDLPKQLNEAFKDLQDFKINPATVVRIGIALADGALDGLTFVEKGFVKLGLNAKTGIVDPIVNGAKALDNLCTKILSTIERIERIEVAKPLVDVAWGKNGLISNPSGFLSTKPDKPDKPIVNNNAPIPRMAFNPNATSEPQQTTAKPDVSVIAELRGELQVVNQRLNAWGEEQERIQNAAIDARKREAALPVTTGLGGGLVLGMERAKEVETSTNIGAGILGGLSIAAGEIGKGLGDLVLASKKSSIKNPEVPKAGIASQLIEDAARLSKQFEDPIEKFKKFTADLDSMVRAKLITPNVQALATMDMGHQLSKSEPARLPGPVEYGSREASRIEAAAYGGHQMQQVDFLRILAEIAEKQLTEAQKFYEASMKENRRPDPIVHINGDG